MKKYFLISLVFLSGLSISFSQLNWQPVTSPVNEDLVSVCFQDQQHGWVLSDQGTLLSTEDGGQTWQTGSLVEGSYTSFHFPDQDHGCALGFTDSSFIMMTVDGGESWQLPDHPKALRLNSVYFHDASHGWAVGVNNNRNYQLYTADGGQSWTPQTTLFVQGAELFSVHFRDGQSGDACGAAGAFFTTSNGGNSWALNIEIPSLGEDLYDLYNWGMFTGCVIGTNGTALYTSNRWSDYIETTTNTSETLYAVSGAPTTNKLWAAGANGTIIHTPNYLLGWTSQSSGTSEDLLDIQMLDEENGWAVGTNGTILKYGIGTGIIHQEQTFSFAFQPNPTAGPVDFSIQLSMNGQIRLSIMDLHGREVEMLMDKRLTAGKHIIHFDLSARPDGIYFIRIEAGDQISMGKVVKM